MKPSEQPVLRDLVLIGGGHSHVGVLRMFAMKPEPGVRITVICTDIDTPYSGMLPGYISGHYSFDEVHIDLGRLCAYTGARFFHDAVVGIDRQNQKVICQIRPPVAYDLLSINIGSTPQVRHVAGAQSLAVPVKPIAQFNQRWLALLDKARQWPIHRGRMTIAVVGAGAGGVELVLSMQQQQLITPKPWLLNVNIPNLPLADIGPMKLCRLGRRHAAESVIQQPSPRGGTMYWIGAAGAVADDAEGTDFHATAQGFASITPLQVDLTDHQRLPYWAPMAALLSQPKRRA